MSDYYNWFHTELPSEKPRAHKNYGANITSSLNDDAVTVEFLDRELYFTVVDTAEDPAVTATFTCGIEDWEDLKRKVDHMIARAGR